MSETSSAVRKRTLSVPQIVGLTLGIALFLLPQVVEFEGLSPAGHRMLGIFFMAIVFWLTEAVPMWANGVLIILLEVLMLSDKGLLGTPDGFKPISYAAIFQSLADPVIILFLGGFFLADTATKFQLDKNLARIILKPVGTNPKLILLGFMVVSAVFSMFMSNTATTATFMAVVLPVIALLPPGDRLRAALALAIPVGANIGGIGTPIGTPPNAIALGALAKASPDGQAPITFIQWMIGAVPFMLIFLAIAYVLLLVLFRSSTKSIKIEMTGRFDRSPKAIIFYITFAGTVVLWMTESIHGLNSNVVGFIPVVVLSCFRIFSVADLQALEWHVLWLVAGGIALGTGIGATGMGTWFVGLFPWETMSPWLLVSVLTLASLIVGTFISHSATTNLLVPIAIVLAKSLDGIDPVSAAVFVAIGSSLAMSLPISTPPNAIAFATGEVKVKDMAVVGAIFGVIAWTIFVFAGPWYWKLMGILPN
jgi:sodium-dependent dicarboxylate transporter 2/3/5